MLGISVQATHNSWEQDQEAAKDEKQQWGKYKEAMFNMNVRLA